MAIESFLGVYALDAVEEDERRMVDDHLTDCPRCRSEVQEHREVAAMLGIATVGTTPDHLWDQIVPGSATEPPTRHLAPVVRLPARHPSAAAWVAGIAAVLALVLGVGVALQTSRVGDLSAELAAREQQVINLAGTLQTEPLDQAVNAALSNPDSQVVSLTSDGSLDAMLIVMLPDGTGYVAQSSLRPLPTDATYQLWAVVDGKVISAGVLGSQPGVIAFHLDPSGLEGLVITQEEAGGVPQSEADPVVTWFEA